jgi:hypothetical protein
MKMLRRLFLFFLAGILTIVFLEFYIKSAEIASLSNFKVNPIWGKILRPNLKLTYFNEGFYMGGVNKYGYLGAGYPQERHGNSIRIVLFGDSFIEGFQLFDRYHFRSILERDLSVKISKKVEILNFGRSGFNLVDMYRYKLDFADKYEPDLCLFFIGIGDLLGESHQVLMPSLYLKDDSLKVNREFVKNKVYRNYKYTEIFRNNSVFLRILDNCFELVKRKKGAQIVLGKFYFLVGEKSTKDPRSYEISFSDLDDISKFILKEIAQDKSIYLVLRPDIPSHLYKEMLDLRLKMIKLEVPLQELFQKGIDPGFWKVSNRYGHWNHAAHRYVGEYLAEIISSRMQDLKY